MIKVIIDIDNTLWDFASILYEKLKKINSEIPDINQWTEWSFWKPYISERDFYRTVMEIHREQDKYSVYPDAHEFLDFLHKNNYTIIIASHRDLRSKQATLNWLHKHKLIFHDLHLSYDKTVLFNNVFAVIDDSPQIISKAKENNINVTGIQFPWNREYHSDLFSSLKEIKEKVFKNAATSQHFDRSSLL